MVDILNKIQLSDSLSNLLSKLSVGTIKKNKYDLPFNETNAPDGSSFEYIKLAHLLESKALNSDNDTTLASLYRSIINDARLVEELIIHRLNGK